jgi:hypothetical protein
MRAQSIMLSSKWSALAEEDCLLDMVDKKKSLAGSRLQPLKDDAATQAKQVDISRVLSVQGTSHGTTEWYKLW